MSSIFEHKELSVTETPLLLFDCVLSDGRIESWSTHRATVGSTTYEARVLQHSLFEIQASSDQGVDGIPKISLVLANSDSRLSEIERTYGWKGARLTVSFVFYCLTDETPATERAVIFQGICNPPEEIREATFRISATNRMNLQRLLMPQVRIQRRCPWTFPATAAQRVEALEGGIHGKYSRHFRCGYSADLAGGSGVLNGPSPFTDCGYSRSECAARGMSRRFGGIDFVPSAIAVRSYGDKAWHQSAVAVNQTRYNDFVPMLYGTAWYTPPVVFARNDGNLTRLEVLLGLGELEGIVKVLVNDVEVPLGLAGADMTGTGWYNLLSLGTREGVNNPDFTDSTGSPAGDPYGSMAYMSLAVPNRLNDGSSLPRVKVLAEGLKLPTYTSDGTFAAERFSANPAWVLLDILRRTGWSEEEIDICSFARAAELCDEPVSALDIYGNDIQLPRFSCNLILQNRRSAGDLIRGIRNAARLLLSYGVNGVLQLRMENRLSVESPDKPEWSNSRQMLDGGWPSYEFGDGTSMSSGILRKDSGEPGLRLFSRSMADTPNRLTVEFQDALNEYQQDSFSLVDPDDVGRSRQEISAPLSALGLPNFNQAARILKLALDKSIRGNTYVEFETSIKGFGIRPGDLITLTYLKEGFDRQLFRILKLSPGTNHRVTRITAQFHDDAWYDDSNGQLGSSSGGRRENNAGLGVPNPLIGSTWNASGEMEFGVEETTRPNSDGTAEATVSVSFNPPSRFSGAAPPIPLVSLAAVSGDQGTLAAGMLLYYAVSASDALGNESALSFRVRAITHTNGSSVTLTGLSFGPGTSTFSLYRGNSPQQLFRIATGQQPIDHFTDFGLASELVASPDPNFDHANFYWRMEVQPELPASVHSAATIGNVESQMPLNRYRGMLVRITRGKGARQERLITANTETTLEVAPSWDTVPDGASVYVIADNGWKMGAIVKASPAVMAIPNRGGEIVHIVGRAANAHGAESPEELAFVSRWQIGGSGNADTDPPPRPFFGLGPLPRGGGVELGGVSFSTLENTGTVSAATVTLHFYDELQGAPDQAVAAEIDGTAITLDISSVGAGAAGDFIQVDREVMLIEAVLNGGLKYRVWRGAHGSAAVEHDAGALVSLLRATTAIAPFPPGFFGSPYSGSWAFPITLPNARVVSAQLFVTNGKGDSPIREICLTNNDDRGMRTCSGGQYSIQISGPLAIDNAAAPPLIIESARSVREVFAVLGTAADRDISLRMNLDGSAYCSLIIPAGLTLSYSVEGNTLKPLPANAILTLSVLSVGLSNPGVDLTVLMRL
jgi:hypothetical protein